MRAPFSRSSSALSCSAKFISNAVRVFSLHFARYANAVLNPCDNFFVAACNAPRRVRLAANSVRLPIQVISAATFKFLHCGSSYLKRRRTATGAVIGAQTFEWNYQLFVCRFHIFFRFGAGLLGRAHLPSQYPSVRFIATTIFI